MKFEIWEIILVVVMMPILMGILIIYRDWRRYNNPENTRDMEFKRIDTIAEAINNKNKK